MNLSMIKGNVIRGGNRALLLAKKASPEILTAVGIGCIVGGTVMACKATLKCDEVLDQHEEGMNKIHEAAALAETASNVEYTEQDMKHDTALQYVHTAKEFVKLYGPAVLVSGTGIACILGGHHILKTRNMALAAAYKALDETFKNYRKRVIEDHGEETDKLYRSGMRKEIVEVRDPENPKKKMKIETLTDGERSMYAKCFDQMSMHWSKNPEYNLLFLKNAQKTANMMLQIRGHLFLNEVYDLLDIPRTQAGIVVGWVDDGSGDNQVDFGIYDLFDPDKRDFLNGYNDAIWLDFNVDGSIYEQI